MPDLTWHKGKHAWESHDDLPRHQHSINGCLTIAPNDSSIHMDGGLPFLNASAQRSYDETRAFHDRESEHVWGAADTVGNLLIGYRAHLTQAERQALSDSVQAFMRLGGRIKRGEIKR